MSRQINGLISQVHRVVWEKMCGRYWTQGSVGDKYIHWVE